MSNRRAQVTHRYIEVLEVHRGRAECPLGDGRRTGVAFGDRGLQGDGPQYGGVPRVGIRHPQRLPRVLDRGLIHWGTRPKNVGTSEVAAATRTPTRPRIK
jgi:hypothetical protein